jgi:hypothetical protein
MDNRTELRQQFMNEMRSSAKKQKAWKRTKQNLKLNTYIKWGGKKPRELQ